MTPREIAHARLRSSRLAGDPIATPVDVVRWLGAVQSQDYVGAKWAVAMRTKAATEQDVERAFAAGEIVRTHVLRPTWHFVASEDVRWMLQLTAPRVRARMATYDRQLGLGPPTMARANRTIERALAGGRHLSRAELATALARDGLAVTGQHLAHVVMNAELEGVVCSGPRRGKDFTYALLEERVAPTPSVDHEEALARLALRYFTSHGPATIADFVWWSGLRTLDARLGVALLESALVETRVGATTYWSADVASRPRRATTAHLLPNYDEYFIGHRDRSAIMQEHDGHGPAYFGWTLPPNVVVLDGQIVGGWRRTDTATSVRLAAREFRPFTAAEHRALGRVVRRFGEFVGRPVETVLRER